jgi:hypothetical protein
MADTIRTLSALQALVVTNTTRQVSAQDLRDWLVSSVGARYVVSVAEATTLDGDDDIVLVDASGGAVTITLPAASGAQHKVYTIKKTDSSANAVTIDGDATETIDGSETQTLSGQYDALTMACDGTGWHIIGETT